MHCLIRSYIVTGRTDKVIDMVKTCEISYKKALQIAEEILDKRGYTYFYKKIVDMDM